MKRGKPTGFVATCQCGKVIGAMDYKRTPQEDAGKILGKWLADGCTVEPRFDHSWMVKVEPCACNGVLPRIVDRPVDPGPNAEL